MRIVAGKFRGRNLVKFDHLKSLRPTTDQGREALFNVLSFGKEIKKNDFNLVDAEVLDVCCGTGAVGLEALSRGAKSVTFIENNRTHLDLLRKNVETLKVENEVKICSFDAKNLPQNQQFFDLIFIDPPYEEDYLAIMESLLEKGWIQKKSLVVVEMRNSPSQPIVSADNSSHSFNLSSRRMMGSFKAHSKPFFKRVLSASGADPVMRRDNKSKGWDDLMKRFKILDKRCYGKSEFVILSYLV